MNFAEAAKAEQNKTFTENGATAFASSSDALVDLFGTIGSLRSTDEDRINRLFAEAYKQDALKATKIAFYGRDITEGLGERKTFRTIIRHMAERMPEALRPNLDLIGVYGRYDDMYALIGTPLEANMWAAMKKQFEEDRKNLAEGNATSLLAKWIKTADASSKATRELGILTAQKLGYSVYDFKRIVRALRKHIGVVETLMSAGKWDEIKYSAVPSRAMMIYRNAFRRHDGERFDEFANKAARGEEKVNAGALYPYDIVEKFLYGGVDNDALLEAQWAQLPNYVEENTHAIVMADTSGSMMGRPLATALGLAMYFAERNKGAYENLFMTFSGKPEFQRIQGDTFAQKIKAMKRADWQMNTDLKAAFDLILDTAVVNHISAEDMPKALIVVSDMEIDDCASKEWGFYDTVKKEFADAGYEIPAVIFWNVNSRHDVFHADANRRGVQLVSGQSVTVFKQLMKSLDMTAVEAMNEVIDSPRYDAIVVEGWCDA